MNSALYLVTASIISAILSSCIGIFVLYKNPKNIQNRVFALFVFFLIVDSIGEALLGLSNSSEEGLIWVRLGFFGFFFMVSAFFHLSLVFPRERMKILKNKFALFMLYLASILLVCIFNLMLSAEDIQLTKWGYRFAFGSNYYYIVVWSIVIAVFTILNFIFSYIHPKTTLERKQIRHIFYGTVIMIIFITGTHAILPIFGIEVFPLGTVSFSIFALFIASAIQRYNIFLFRPLVEPGFEEKKEGPKIYELKPSSSYIVREQSGEQGYEIFTDQITHDVSGLCVTKFPPHKIRAKYCFEKTPLIWFTFKQSNKETTIDPKKTDVELIPQIEDFVKRIRQTVVYIDCFDQIMVVKGFGTTLRLIRDIRKICKEHNSTLLLSIDPNAFEKRHQSFFERDFLEVS